MASEGRTTTVRCSLLNHKDSSPYLRRLRTSKVSRLTDFTTVRLRTTSVTVSRDPSRRSVGTTKPVYHLLVSPNLMCRPKEPSGVTFTTPGLLFNLLLSYLYFLLFFGFPYHRVTTSTNPFTDTTEDFLFCTYDNSVSENSTQTDSVYVRYVLHGSLQVLSRLKMSW